MRRRILQNGWTVSDAGEDIIHRQAAAKPSWSHTAPAKAAGLAEPAWDQTYIGDYSMEPLPPRAAEYFSSRIRAAADRHAFTCLGRIDRPRESRRRCSRRCATRRRCCRQRGEIWVTANQAAIGKLALIAIVARSLLSAPDLACLGLAHASSRQLPPRIQTIRSIADHCAAYLDEMVLVTQDRMMRPYGGATLGLNGVVTQPPPRRAVRGASS